MRRSAGCCCRHWPHALRPDTPARRRCTPHAPLCSFLHRARQTGRLTPRGLLLDAAQARGLISSVDVDGSGTIEFSEFLVIMARRMLTTEGTMELDEARRARRPRALSPPIPPPPSARLSPVPPATRQPS